MKHDILQSGDSTVTCRCGSVIAGSSLEDARRKFIDHFWLMKSRDQLAKEDDDA